jgi:hypothetical protein
VLSGYKKIIKGLKILAELCFVLLDPVLLNQMSSEQDQGSGK